MNSPTAGRGEKVQAHMDAVVNDARPSISTWGRCMEQMSTKKAHIEESDKKSSQVRRRALRAPMDPSLLVKVLFEATIYFSDNRKKAAGSFRGDIIEDLFVLSAAAPKPGVSMRDKRRRTPFSSRYTEVR
jgi:hypothetical protein